MPAQKRRLDVAQKGSLPRRNGAIVAPEPGSPRRERRPETVRSAIRYDLRWLEPVAWILVAALALGIRLINVDGAPLQPAESRLAMDSWRIVQHTGVALGSSPLFVYLNALLFLVLGATDAVARAVPVVVGSATAMSPFLLRHRLGRLGSLAAALFLATSPTLVFASRTVDPTMLSVGLGVALILTGDGYVRLPSSRYLYAGAVLSALLLMSGPLAYDLAIILIGFLVVSGADGVQNVLGIERGTDNLLSSIGIAFGLTVALVGTGLATNLEGLGVSLAAPLAVWAASFSGFAAHPAWLYPALMVGYEPLALIFGIVGAAIAFRRGRPFEIFLGWWTCIGFLLLVLSNGDPSWNALIVVPLGMLAGPVVDELPSRFADLEQRRRLAIFVGVAVPLLATMLIAFGYVTLPDPVIPREIALAAPLALLAFVASYAFGYDWQSAVEATAVVAVACLLAFSVHAAMLLNPGGQLNPAEFFTGTATSTDVRKMTTDVSTVLDELSIAQRLEGRTVNQTVEVARPFADPVAWYLKNESGVQIVDQVSDAPGIAIVGSKDKAPRGAYAGELFQFSVSAPRPGTSFGGLWRWWIYHQSGSRTGTYVKVYVKTQLARP